MKTNDNTYHPLREHLRNFWIGLKQHKFRILRERPDSERFVKRRTKRFRSVKHRYSYKIAKADLNL
jgi:hypothetical protein